MSASTSSDCPITVTVSAYAQEPTQSGNHDGIPVYATAVEPSSYIPTVVASPAQNHVVSYERHVPRGLVALGIYSPYAPAASENIIRALNRSRSLRCLASVDMVILLIFAIFLPIVLVLIVGKHKI